VTGRSEKAIVSEAGNRRHGGKPGGKRSRKSYLGERWWREYRNREAKMLAGGIKNNRLWNIKP